MSRSSLPSRGIMPLLVFVATAAWALATPAGLHAQAATAPRAISLADAIRLGSASSEALAIARAAIDDATGERIRAAGMKRMRVDAWTSVDRALRTD